MILLSKKVEFMYNHESNMLQTSLQDRNRWNLLNDTCKQHAKISKHCVLKKHLLIFSCI